jgi:hypothetical protein
MFKVPKVETWLIYSRNSKNAKVCRMWKVRETVVENKVKYIQRPSPHVALCRSFGFLLCVMVKYWEVERKMT